MNKSRTLLYAVLNENHFPGIEVFVTIIENPISCSPLSDYGAINFTLPTTHYLKK